MHILFLLASLLHAQSFPKNFKWCVATADHQIEGNDIHSDWWDWEKLDGKIKNNEHSGLATNHTKLYLKDIEIMKKLGIQTYRFSLSWSKIQPEQNKIDYTVLKNYQNFIELLLKNNIEPMITLHHFVNPQWFQAKGGWEMPDAPEIFLKYLKIIYPYIGKKTTLWTTFNEPMVLIGGGYIQGLMPPGKSGFQFEKPLVNILKTHAEIYQYLKAQARSEKREISIGFAHHIRFFQAQNPDNFLEKMISEKVNEIFNWAILDALANGRLKISIPFLISIDQDLPQIKKTQDYIGINYYTREFLYFSFRDFQFRRHFHPTNPRSDLDWEIYPTGLRQSMDEMKKRFPKVPLFITENGIADQTDKYRKKYIFEHLQVLQQAITQGLDILGYCHWSLMDNYEWIEGFGPRFGLYEVDYKTFNRKGRPSADYFRQIIEKNELIPIE
ncbi:MAG: glycoside hydrolase family 1 protein [Bacteriovoracaceae bacterium]|nr:glycoside hydrolase family 1 protein [Bacteriovoracaceae bacterium]